MTLAEVIAEIKTNNEKTKTEGILAVVYDNWRVIGTVGDIENAIEKFKTHNEIDLSEKEILYRFGGCAYGQAIQTAVCYIDSKAKPEEDTGKNDGTDEAEKAEAGDTE